MRHSWIAAAILPLFVYAVFFLSAAVRLEREMLQRNLEVEMNATAALVQRTLVQETAFLSGLTVSNALRSSDLSTMRREAEFAREMHPSIHTITLYDRDAVVFDLRVPSAQPLPPLMEAESGDAVWTTDEPSVGGWVDGKIEVRVSFRVNGQVRYILSELLESDVLSDLLRSGIRPQGWIASLIDQNMTIVARSDQAEQFVGSKPTGNIVEAIRQGRTTLEKTVTKEGIASLGAVIPLADTGWHLAMAMPEALAEQSYRPIRLLLIGGGGVALLLGLMVYGVIIWRNVRKLECRTEALSTHLVDANRRTVEASAFIAMMSHELRTPLTGVIGFSELLAKSRLNEKQKNWVEHQRTAGRTLLTVINDVLDYSKIEAGSIRLENIVFDLHQLAEDCITLVQPMAEAKGVGLVLDRSPDVPHWLRGDPIRIEQVIGNFLNNAIKFTTEGEVRLILDLTVSPSGQPLLMIEVRDTGIGIPANKRDCLFQRFSQVSSSTTRKYGGTGLGLAICKSLITLMEGDIGVSSVDGQGSTFWFTIPLTAAEEPASAIPSIAAEAEPPVTGRHILVVEDNPITQILTRTILEQAGHHVAVADNGADAVEAVKHIRFDLILMDVHLPVLDGPAATRAIRELEGDGSHLTIIALTADATRDDAAACLSIGMDGHLTKPFLPADLLATVNAVFRQKGPVEPAPQLPSMDVEMRDAMTSAIGERNMAVLQTAFLQRAELAKSELAAARNNLEQLDEAAHQLIGAAGMLGYRGVVQAARALCQACRAADGERVPGCYATLVDELDRVGERQRPAMSASAKR
ncbi:hybrid sensor histidine kinase/response regulator [Azospirillum sp. TSO35-2]|uniref:hybrid sensor histidine kinase/response regulator n=1 Tax=Azospirillum sp. TSO35-2 TaxID=716796 RepID=UPI000D65CAA5|nr:hybrid sensor histidine kinase/response regulator [Azospirillum sp. TSO35-2]